MGELRALDDIRKSIYHLLQSHGWAEELYHYAELQQDYETVIVHRTIRRDFAGALERLGEFMAAGAGEDLVCRFMPVLFGAEPRAAANLLMRPAFKSVDPIMMLPAVSIRAGHSSAVHNAEAARYLEYVRRQRPAAPGGGGSSSAGAGAEAAAGGHARVSGRLSAGGDALGAIGVTDEGVASDTAGRGWATGTAVLNAVTLLYASGNGVGGDSEEALLRFFAEQESNAHFDTGFALRVCVERGLTGAAVLLYGIMGMYEETVEHALRRDDLPLAIHNACKPADRRLVRRLWLRIVEHKAATSDVEAIIALVRDSKELSVHDALPYMSEAVTIDSFQDDIRACLDKYESEINTLRQEMDDHKRALGALKEDLKRAEQRTVTIDEDQPCALCGVPALLERFFVFSCGHCFHEACIRDNAIPHLSGEQRRRLFALEAIRLEHAAAAAGAVSGVEATPSVSLAKAEEELDGILADDCPLCGRLMISAIRRPFLDSEHEKEEIESWAIT
eukprot:NODE_3318_length_2054_cov_3.249611.p1 GENE.NODE_3318_length_2054_cov_3.249611~~NODE_3318_length_2054_cov_3.249611.p1  ORF type:complete len:504 (-),score=183.39 NODE_3318_length_2054_cov_3.249611:178-1689(-)